MELRSDSHLPRPDVDHHVMLVSHADDVFAAGRKNHAGDAVFVLLELGHLTPLCHIPQPHRRQVSTLRREERRKKGGEILKKTRIPSFTCIHSFCFFLICNLEIFKSPVLQPALITASYRVSKLLMQPCDIKEAVDNGGDRRSGGE